MLVEIKCDQFRAHGSPRGVISLHAGLNTVVGGAAAENSVGKSTFLMIIDFIFGGNDYVEKLTDVQEEIGEHSIYYAFQFEDGIYRFVRSTKSYRTVARCDENYRPLPEGRVSLDRYLLFLQEHYHLNYDGLTFRNAVGRSIRVWGRDTLDENHPLHQVRQEKTKTAIEGLLRLANLYEDIKIQSRRAKEAGDQYATLKNAQKYQYLPCVKKETDYVRNEKRIHELSEQKAELVRQSTGGFLDLDSVLSERLSLLQTEMTQSRRRRHELVAQLQAYRIDRTRNEHGPCRDYNELQRFFPGVNLQDIEATERFHNQLTRVLHEEFEESERSLLSEISSIDFEILQLEEAVRNIATTTDLSEAVLRQYSAIEMEQKALQDANNNYKKKMELREKAKDNSDKLDQLVLRQITSLQNDINEEMASINTTIYGGHKTSPVLDITDASHYSFYTPRDRGTGTQYRGLIEFDLALLNLTPLPIIIHDSGMLKQIEDDAIEKIMGLYSSTCKQVFIAIDKTQSYTVKTQEMIRDSKVLQLESGEGALFGRTWNE